MSDKIHRLVTKEEAIQADIQKEAVMLLEEIAEEAKSGEITEVCILARHRDGTFSESMSSSIQIVDWIGRLEVTKFGLIARNISHVDRED